MFGWRSRGQEAGRGRCSAALQKQKKKRRADLVGLRRGSLKDTFCSHLKHDAFSTKKGNHHLQVAMFRCFACIRIPVRPKPFCLVAGCWLSGVSCALRRWCLTPLSRSSLCSLNADLVSRLFELRSSCRWRCSLWAGLSFIWFYACSWSVRLASLHACCLMAASMWQLRGVATRGRWARKHCFPVL